MAPAELICVAVWSFAVAVAGGLTGLVLGNLRLPVVLQFSTSAAAGAGANVAISAASAFTASIAHWRGGRIDWRLFWLMVPPSLLGGILGGVASGLLPQRLLLGTIAVVVFYGAVEIARRGRTMATEPPPSGGVMVAMGIAFAVGVLGGLVGLRPGDWTTTRCCERSPRSSSSPASPSPSKPPPSNNGPHGAGRMACYGCE